ncbi:hypothetical protein RDI58_029040 [Solanum bulbocastanum]|jgi:hypothetical protein
MALTL